jgi:hypothetical protein
MTSNSFQLFQAPALTYNQHFKSIMHSLAEIMRDTGRGQYITAPYFVGVVKMHKNKPKFIYLIPLFEAISNF